MPYNRLFEYKGRYVRAWQEDGDYILQLLGTSDLIIGAAEKEDEIEYSVIEMVDGAIDAYGADGIKSHLESLRQTD